MLIQWMILILDEEEKSKTRENSGKIGVILSVPNEGDLDTDGDSDSEDAPVTYPVLAEDFCLVLPRQKECPLVIPLKKMNVSKGHVQSFLLWYKMKSNDRFFYLIQI